MRRFFILLLVVLMPLKALAASYDICSQHHAQALISVDGNHDHAKLKTQAEKNGCADCHLYHIACGTFVLSSTAGLTLQSSSSHTLDSALAVSFKAQASDPPYRPKWLALA